MIAATFFSDHDVDLSQAACQDSLFPNAFRRKFTRVKRKLFASQSARRFKMCFVSPTVLFVLCGGREYPGNLSQLEIEKAERNFHQIARAKAHLRCHKLPSPAQIDFQIPQLEKGLRSLFLFGCELKRKEKLFFHIVE